MMFPDTSDEKQLAALRLAAERSRSNIGSQDKLERGLSKARPPLSETTGAEGSQSSNASAAGLQKRRMARG